MSRWKTLPRLLDTTDERRRVYELQGVINKKRIDKLVIDPHYEKNHGGYMNDEKIYILVQELLRTQRFVFSNRKEKWEYFEADIFYREKKYRLAFCLEDERHYLGIIDCYRKSKYGKKN